MTGKPDHFLKPPPAEISDASILSTPDSEPQSQTFPQPDWAEIHHQPGCSAAHGPEPSSTVLMHGVLQQGRVFAKLEEF